MRDKVWIIGVILGFLVVIVMVVSWRFMKQDLDDKAVDMIVRHHNESLERMKASGVIDPDTPAVTREDLERKRQEALQRLREEGGVAGVQQQVNEQLAEAHRLENGGSYEPPLARRGRQAPAAPPPQPEASSADTEMMLLMVSFGVIVLLTLGGIGAAVYVFSRQDAPAAPRVAEGPPPSPREPPAGPPA